ncbi:hypothetical protein PAESOLCIP111_03379 [Paenibacillus solanacearum]|uniref:Uncharacterized protein n=1 Tax=Paenibacillus solanacearum TaxID=2048548 RepID=A0A916K3W5_9BACL|nr:hypothetical protein PAESOLCIP111_03379 [Paenibacillus solanacearum]
MGLRHGEADATRAWGSLLAHGARPAEKSRLTAASDDQ